MVDEGAVEGVTGAIQGGLTADAAARELAGRGGDASSCMNCGEALTGRFCTSCGQIADHYHRPIWGLLADALEGLFSLDGRFMRTVPALMLRPGRVSANYLAGARARYMQPFRLFLLASVVLFVALSIAAGDLGRVFEPGQLNEAQRDAARVELNEAIAEIEADGGGVGAEAARAGLEAAREGLEAVDAADGERAGGGEQAKCGIRAALLPEDPISAACSTLLDDKEDGFSVDLGDSVSEWPHGVRLAIADRFDTVIDRPEAWIAAMQRWAPRLVFVLFPVYALLLALLHFWRRKIFVYDHTIVSLHFHSFLFILILAWLALSTFVTPAILIPAVFIWSNVYLYRTLRLVYADSRFGAVVRTVLLDFTYLIILAFAFVGLMALGVAFV